MVGTSRSSLKDSERLQNDKIHLKSHAKVSVSTINRTRQLRNNDEVPDSDGSDRDDIDNDVDGLHLATGADAGRKTRTTATTITSKQAGKKTLATSKSLPNLVVRTTKNTASAVKRPRLPSSSSTPSPPPPPSSHPPPRSSPRRPHRRAPLTNRHPSSSQQTTLDKFLGNKVNNDINIRAEAETNRPVKKARLDHDGPHATNLSSPNIQNRESPDPLNVISPPASPERIRTRQRGNTLTNTSITKETIPTSPTLLDGSTATSSSTTRATRNKAHNTVIIADDDTAKPRDEEQSVNGQKQAANTSQAPEKRSLRSHDGGSRSKSELALYFPNYEQIISLEPVKTEFLAPETTVSVLDDLTESPLSLASPVQSASPSRTRKQLKSIEQISPFGNPLTDLHAVEKIQLPKSDSDNVIIDPLSDDVYFKAHRRHERQEKQLRNIEKERAQHEKIQLDRLLDELQGHDWLRVMGISGITDTEKKLYEPKRDYFVKEVSSLIDKFRMWKEEEKRRKLEREQMLQEAAAAAAAEEDEEQEGEDEEEQDEDAEMYETREVEDEGDSELAKPPSSDIQSLDSSELDAAAARQLIQEARSATANGSGTTAMPSPSTPPQPQPQPRRRLVDELTGSSPKVRSSRTNSNPHTNHTVTAEVPFDENKPFISFYPKRHLRDAAFFSSRRGGRNRSAFGQPLPELEEREFELPSEILTTELVTSLERKRRRLKRESRG